jgi:hypothetical protein
MIPVAQTVAALLALPIRANVPVAALTTFITNPLTTPPIWVAGYWIGSWMLKVDPVNDRVESEAISWLQWLLSDAAPATALGLVGHFRRRRGDRLPHRFLRLALLDRPQMEAPRLQQGYSSLMPFSWPAILT